MKAGMRVVTVLGSGVITDVHTEHKKVAVKLDAACGQEWFDYDEIELGESECGVISAT